jgi:hypothetical protein
LIRRHKIASSLVWLGIAELWILSNSSTIGGFKTNAVSDFGGKVLIAGNTWHGVKFYILHIMFLEKLVEPKNSKNVAYQEH